MGTKKTILKQIYAHKRLEDEEMVSLYDGEFEIQLIKQKSRNKKNE